MYINKVTVKPDITANAFFKMFGDMYKTHQTIWSLFEETNKTKFERNFVFMRDDSEKFPTFYIVSEKVPKSHRYCYIDTKEYTPKVVAGQKLAFLTCINPVVTRQDPEYIDVKGVRQRGKHHNHYVVIDAIKKLKDKGISDEKTCNDVVQEECVMWLTTRGQNAGFEIDTSCTSVNHHDYLNAYGKEGNKLTFATATISGALKVTEPNKFTQTLYKGIGKGKGFGCGLILVKPLRSLSA